MKKALAIVVALIMVMALIPVTAGAEFAKTRELSSTQFAPRHQESRAAVLDAANDGSLLNENMDDYQNTMGDWWMYDNDDEEYTYDNWVLVSGSYDDAESGYSMTSLSYISSTGAMNADNWLITPSVTIPTTGTYYLSYYVKSQDPNYPDALEVLVGEDGEAFDDSSIYLDMWTTIRPLDTVTSGEWGQESYDLSAFAGKTVAVAFRHVDYDAFRICLDFVQIGQMGEAVDVTGVTVDPATLTLGVTEGAQLTATVEPANATFPKVTWASSDPTVVSVNKNGGILAMSAGTATITATTSNGVYGTCVVTVEAGDNAYAGNLITYGVYDLDNDNNPNTWYWVDEMGVMAAEYEDGANTFVKGAWNPVDQLFYAYRSNSDDTMDFVSIDPMNDFAVTVITANIADNPWWISYGFDTGVMYGGFLKFDSDDNITGFEFAEIDLATGLEGNVVIDVYNQTLGGEEAMEFLPLHTTYAGGGIFIGADYNYSQLLMYAPNYNDSGFAAGYVSDYSLSDQVGGIETYMQDIYYNPMDGMLYWAYVGNNCDMVVMDIASGVAVPTGRTGLAGAVGGIECSILDGIYTMVQTYTVTFYDSLTGDVIAEVEVAEGEAAEAPEAPVHEGYTFTGWDADFSNVTGDMDVYALYEQNAPAGLLGDVDCDGEVTFSDISLLAQYLAGNAALTEQGMANADMDQNGDITFADVGAIYQFLVG